MRGAVFRRYGKELYPYFGMTTFLGYRTPSVTKPLILTGANTGNSALHRFWETCRFWTDIGEVDGRDAAMTSSPPPRFEYACCTA
jgi:hypothetical protein